MEYHQKEDVLDSQASSFPTLYLDGATLLFSVFQFQRKHELGVVDIYSPPFFFELVHKLITIVIISFIGTAFTKDSTF